MRDPLTDLNETPEVVSIDGREHYRYADGTTLPVIRGGDGSTEGGDDQGADDQGEGDESGSTDDVVDSEGEGEGEGDDDGDVGADFPDVDLDTATEAELYAAHTELEDRYKAERAGADDDPAKLPLLRAIRKRQAELSEAIEEQRAEQRKNADELGKLDEAAPEVTPPAKVAATDFAKARGTQPKREQATPAPIVAMVGGGDQEVVAPGAEIDFGEMGTALGQLVAQRAPGKAVLAHVPAYDMPRDQVLNKAHGAERNDELIRESVEEWEYKKAGATGDRPPVLAAICDPLEPIREIPDCADGASPVADLFPSRPVGRGGFQFHPGVDLNTLAGGVVADWDDDNQEAVDEANDSTWKPCIHIDCPDVETVRARAAAACFTYDVTTDMSAPERIRNVTSEISKMRTRAKEAGLLTIIDGFSANAGTYSTVNGTLPALVEWVATTIAQTSFGPRLGDRRWALVVEEALVAAVAIDLANRAFSGERAEARSRIREEMAQLGVDVAVTLETANLANPYGAITNGPALPAQSRVRLLTPSDGIYGDTGDVNVGVTRSPQLLRQNRAQYFSEEFYLLARHGCGPWVRGDLELCPNGARTGFNVPAPCNAS